jgi:hypothetical protein
LKLRDGTLVQVAAGGAAGGANGGANGSANGVPAAVEQSGAAPAATQPGGSQRGVAPPVAARAPASRRTEP